MHMRGCTQRIVYIFKSVQLHGWLGGPGGGLNTRPHSELGSESPQRRWYFVLRRGRVGRCQAFHAVGQINMVIGAKRTKFPAFVFFFARELGKAVFICGVFVLIFFWRGVEQSGSSSGS